MTHRKKLRARAAQTGLALGLLASSFAWGQTYSISTFAGGGLPNNIPATSASAGYPFSVAVDSSGNVFFAVAERNVVLRLDRNSGILTVVAGNGIQGYSGDSGPATSAELYAPNGVALDSAGNLYIADLGNHRVRKVSGGVITTVAGNGLLGYGGDNGPATSASLFPIRLAVDAAGNLYISDYYDVRKVSGGVITKVAGNGTQGFSGDNGPATSAQLSQPYGLAVDAAGNLYIADVGNSRIRKVSSGVITTVAGNGTAGYSGDNGPATSAQLFYAAGVAVDAAGNLYLADTDNNRVRKVSNGVITTVAGTGTQGFSGDSGQAASARLAQPGDVAVDTAGTLYIADSWNYRIRTVSNGVIATIAGNGTQGFSGDNGPATSAQLSGPFGLAVDTAGNLYISDFGLYHGTEHIRKVAQGVITTVAGNGAYGFSGDNGPATNAEFNSPEGIAVDASGNLYIADEGNTRIREVSNGIITTVAGTDYPGSTADNIPATTAYLSYSAGVAAGSAGTFYIATGQNTIRKVSNGVITTVAGNGVAGYGGDNGPATAAQLSGPEAVAVDAAGNLYIADTGNNRIRKVSNGVITTVAGNGTKGFGGDNGPATSAQLSGPFSLAVDAAGSIYIADSGNNRIRKVSGGVITTIAGNGIPGFGGDNGPATNAELFTPWGVAVDSAGNVYVADTVNYRIRLLTPAPASCTYSLAPTSLNVSVAGGNLTVGIQTAAGCPWIVSGLPAWITVSGSSYGLGSGTVTLIVSSNTLFARTATISIAGVAVTVTQPGSFAITSSAALPSGFVGGAYSQTLTAAGGTPPYTWSLTAGSLPSGLALSASGAITGTPAAAGTSTFTIQATDSTNASASQAFTLTIATLGALTRTGVFSHIVSDGGWQTSMSLVNTGALPVSVRMILYADNGTPLSLPLAITQGATQTLTANTVDAVINPNSTLLVATTSHNAVNVEGWVDVLATGPVNGFAIFTYAYTGSSPSEGTVPLQTQVTAATLDAQYDNTGGDLTGIALANLSFAPVTVTATVWDAGGNQLLVQSFTLPGSGHTSFGATDKFPATAGKSGLIQFQSSSGLAGIGLRFSPSLTFTSVPTITP